MKSYPEKPSSFINTLLNSVKYYYSIFRLLIPIMLLIVVVKDFYWYMGGMPNNWILCTIVAIIMAILIIYFWAVALWIGHLNFKEQRIKLADAFHNIFKRLLPIYLCCVVYLAGIAVIILIAKLLIYFAVKVWGHPVLFDRLGMIFLAGLPIIYGLVLTLFAFPLVVTEKKPVLSAFAASARMTVKYWFNSFAVYFSYLVIIVLISPNTILSHLLRTYYVAVLFDFLVLCIFMPVAVNLTLLMLNNLRLRRAG